MSKRIEHIIAENYSVYFYSSDGDIYSWGNNDYGQLGHNMFEYDRYSVEYNYTTITKVALPKNVKVNTKHDIKVHNYNNKVSVYLLASDGNLYTWGNNEYYQLGRDTTINENNVQQEKVDENLFKKILNKFSKNKPVEIDEKTKYMLSIEVASTPTKIDIKLKSMSELLIHNSTLYAISTDNKLYTWGGNKAITLIDIPVTSISNIRIFDDVIYALGSDNKLYTWGGSHTPLSFDLHVDSMDNVIIDNNSVYVYANGKIYSWGNNEYGQLGRTTSTDEPIALDLQIDNRNDIIVNNGSVYAFSNGKLYSWGSNTCGQLGRVGETHIPTAIELNLSSIDSVRVYNAKVSNAVFEDDRKRTNYYPFVFALDDDNVLYSWGYNQAGELGRDNKNADIGEFGHSKPEEVELDVKLKSLNDVRVHYSASYKYNDKEMVDYTFIFALCDEYTLYGWGCNNAEQLMVNIFIMQEQELYVMRPRKFNLKTYNGNENSLDEPYAYLAPISLIDDIITYYGAVILKSKAGYLYGWGGSVLNINADDNSLPHISISLIEVSYIFNYPIKVDSISDIYTFRTGSDCFFINKHSKISRNHIFSQTHKSIYIPKEEQEYLREYHSDNTDNNKMYLKYYAGHLIEFYALTSDRQLHSWGNEKNSNNCNQNETMILETCKDKKSISSISQLVNTPHVLFILTNDGKLYTWGKTIKDNYSIVSDILYGKILQH